MSFFKNEIIQIQNAYRKCLRVVAATAVNFSKERFVRKDWVDRSSQKWKQTSKKKGSTLVASGQLKRSIRLIKINTYQIHIGSDIPYAKIHNEGGHIQETVSVRGHYRTTYKRKKGKSKKKNYSKNRHYIKPHSRQMNTTIPQRKFIGVSAILERRIERAIDKVFRFAIR